VVEYQEENMLSMRGEIDACAESHWHEVLAGLPFELQWSLIETMVSVGAFRIFTARDNGELVGYIAFVSGPMITSPMKAHDQVGLWVKPSHRGPAIAVRLVRFAEAEFRKEPRAVVVQHSMSARPVEPLYRRLGYSKTESVFTKQV